jgi:hypothetical protein
MDERTIKRLLITVGVAIAIILIAKFMLTKAITHVGQATLEKKQAAAAQQASAPAAEPAVVDVPDSVAASAVSENPAAASSVETTGH